MCTRVYRIYERNRNNVCMLKNIISYCKSYGIKKNAYSIPYRRYRLLLDLIYNGGDV